MVKDVVKVGNPVPGRFAGEGRAKDPGGVTVAHPDLHGVYDIAASNLAASHQHYLASIRIIVASVSVTHPILVEVGQVGK